MNFKFLVVLYLCFSFFNVLPGSDFTVSSYNCGGLSNHYDYLRAAAMQNLIQARHDVEPAEMAKLEKIEKLALKILFSNDVDEQLQAQQVWNADNYQQALEQLVAVPSDLASPNAKWHAKSEAAITSYKIRPVAIMDSEAQKMLADHLKDLNKLQEISYEQTDFDGLISTARRIMGERIFKHMLKYEIICLQEADYLEASMFPEGYQVSFSHSEHSVNGIAWNVKRFKLVEEVGNILDRAFAIKLKDIESDKTILIVSGHITGCNPFQISLDPVTQEPDSAKGDHELTSVFDLFENISADIKLIGMDSNVTATHPRLKIVKNFGYQLDYENYLEPTCTNPYQVLNTRIDWIAAKAHEKITINNIPVYGVGLNSIQTNMSDHKPVAARITFE